MGNGCPGINGTYCFAGVLHSMLLINPKLCSSQLSLPRNLVAKPDRVAEPESDPILSGPYVGGSCNLSVQSWGFSSLKLLCCSAAR